MAVRIRLQRIGKRHVPFFRIVAQDVRKKRDGAFLEDLGTYDALKTKLVKYNAERIEDWISKGAIPSDAVKRLQKLHKRVLEGKDTVKKVKPKKEIESVEASVAEEAKKGTEPQKKSAEKIVEAKVEKKETAAKKVEAKKEAKPTEKTEAPKKEKIVEKSPEKPSTDKKA